MIAGSPGKTAERSQATMIGDGCKGFLAEKKYLENVSGQCGDWLLTYTDKVGREICG